MLPKLRAFIDYLRTHQPPERMLAAPSGMDGLPKPAAAG